MDSTCIECASHGSTTARAMYPRCVTPSSRTSSGRCGLKRRRNRSTKRRRSRRHNSGGFSKQRRRIYVWLTWMTASRCSDVSSLEKRCVTLSRQHLVIDFQGVTKATRTDPWRLDHLVAIPLHIRGVQDFWTWWAAPRLLRPTTTHVTALLRRILGGGAFSAHSIKHSAPFTAQHHDKVHQRQTPASVGERERESSAGPGPLRRRGAHFLGNTRPTRIPTTVEELALPLHAKRVRTLDLANLTELARGHVLERRLTELLPFVESATPYDSMVQRGTPVVSTITDSDLQAMKEAELVREVPASEVKNVRLWCKFFTVVEAAKQRRRIILWPRQGNAEVDYDCDIDLMSTLDHISQPTMGDWAACFDLTASFYQWPLNREVHNFFGFRDRSGRAFVFPLLFFETIFILLFSFGVNKVQK
eukprot:PhM_4_TR11687/c2_g1_i1/m.76298